MRIAITGPLSGEAISKAESILKVEVKKPWQATILDQAAETYKYFNESNVIFEGSTFDYLTLEPAEGYDDLYEQICIDSLNNVDYIAVITMDMDRRQLEIYKEYQKLFPNKIYLYSSPVEFEVRLK
jgi:hypothetical protein